MGCPKGGVFANRGVPTSDYVRFATHYGAKEESKGIVDTTSSPDGFR